MATKDPRYYPEPGDVIEREDCTTFEVISVTGGYGPGGYVNYRRCRDSQDEPEAAKIRIAIWQRQARECRVLRTGGTK